MMLRSFLVPVPSHVSPHDATVSGQIRGVAGRAGRHATGAILSRLRAEGGEMTVQQFRHLKPHATEFAGLDTFPAPPGVTVVRMVSDEVTALCPVTGQPDWYEVAIAYRPDAMCIESKSLKLYFQTFRDQGIFCEAFAEQIARDVMEACAPRWVRTTIIQKARGGISITATAKVVKEAHA
jgi:7-cyano-7-deazaguanine reductase